MRQTVLRPTDITDPATGEPLYVEFTPRSVWAWRWRKLSLFASLVWRRYECSRLTAQTAWEIAGIMYDDRIKEARP